MKNEQTTTLIEQPEPCRVEEIKVCPLSNASGAVKYCNKERCTWYVTDSGIEECAIVKLARGWCL